jgi:hypothetical protein
MVKTTFDLLQSVDYFFEKTSKNACWSFGQGEGTFVEQRCRVEYKSLRHPSGCRAL